MGSKAMFGPKDSGHKTCPACKSARRKCKETCEHAKYFGPDDTKKFATVQKLFGSARFIDHVNAADESLRDVAAAALIYEAECWKQDPVHGCLGIIRRLQEQLKHCMDELALVTMELNRFQQLQVGMGLPLDGYERDAGILNEIGTSTEGSSSSFVPGARSYTQYQMLQQDQQQQRGIMLNAKGNRLSGDPGTAGVSHPIQQQPLQYTQHNHQQIPQHLHPAPSTPQTQQDKNSGGLSDSSSCDSYW